MNYIELESTNLYGIQFYYLKKAFIICNYFGFNYY